jgi:hypothetical protein
MPDPRNPSLDLPLATVAYQGWQLSVIGSWFFNSRFAHRMTTGESALCNNTDLDTQAARTSALGHESDISLRPR